MNNAAYITNPLYPPHLIFYDYLFFYFIYSAGNESSYQGFSNCSMLHVYRIILFELCVQLIYPYRSISE